MTQLPDGAASTAEDEPLKQYVGLIWVDDRPGVRLSVWARSAEEAGERVRDEYGEGHPMSIWNEDDAAKPRRA